MARTNGGFNGMFVFGDSIVDAGNNNFRRMRFKANCLPYGTDFLIGGLPTGGFTNRKNQADCIGDVLGLPRIPPFSDPLTKGITLSSGVNHASAGSGILESTGSTSVVLSLRQQIRNFVEGTLPDLEAQQGCPSTYLLPHYLFLFATGSNDFLACFLQEIRNNVTLESFTADLTSSLATEITAKIVQCRGKKVRIFGYRPPGCTPLARAAMPKKACDEAMNYAAFLFNTSIRVYDKPLSKGFSEVTTSCCEVSVQSGVTLQSWRQCV